MSQWSHYSAKDAEWEAALPAVLAQRAKNRRPTANAPEDIAAQRENDLKMFKDELQNGDYPREGYTVTDHNIPVGNGVEVESRIYVPDAASDAETFPVLINLHGGGFVYGNIHSDEMKCRKLCLANRIVVVNVNYRHAPEHPFPCGLNDSYSAVKWVSKHCTSFHGDTSKGFILCGLSAGGAFTEVITQQARGDPELRGKITGQVLQIAPTLGNGNGYQPEKYKSHLLSYAQNTPTALLTPQIIQQLMSAYQPGPDDDLRCSPLLAESLAGLPPAYLQIGGGDLFRDESLLYAQRLVEDGVPTKFDVYPGLPHAFNFIMPNIKATKKWNQDLEDNVKWLLELPGKAQ